MTSIHQAHLHYRLSAHDPLQPHDGLIHHPLTDMLAAVARYGSISAASRSMQLSYRHVWGALKQWEAELGGELIVWGKGQAAKLSPLGTRLLWTERQSQARLAPQIQALRAGMERALAVALDPQALVLRLSASYDPMLALLQTYASSLGPHSVHLDIVFRTSLDAMQDLQNGSTRVALLPTGEALTADSLTAGCYRPLLQPGQHSLIGLLRRRQGLIVASGNPLQLRSLQDVLQRRARFVHRPPGSNTHLLLGDLLQQAGLPVEALDELGDAEPNGVAVAQAVASDQADVGLGTAPAAISRGLDFVPLTHERYHLVCTRDELANPALQALCRLLQSPGWHQRLAEMPGLQAMQSGMLLPARRALPWL